MLLLCAALLQCLVALVVITVAMPAGKGISRKLGLCFGSLGAEAMCTVDPLGLIYCGPGLCSREAVPEPTPGKNCLRGWVSLLVGF